MTEVIIGKRIFVVDGEVIKVEDKSVVAVNDDLTPSPSRIESLKEKQQQKINNLK